MHLGGARRPSDLSGTDFSLGLAPSSVRRFRAMADGAQVRVDQAHHVLASMLELAADGVEADRCTAVESLGPSTFQESRV